jgi:LPXTG-motif cell wall-anchored protein
MNKKLIIIGLLGLAGVGYYFYNKKKKETPSLAEYIEDDVVLFPNTISVTTKQSTKPDYDKILKLGSKGIEVKILQKALKQVDVDGDFGVDTDKRLKKVTGFNQITLNQYNQIIDKLQNIKAKQLKEAKVKAEQKKAEAKKVVVQPKPTTSFTAGLITTL